jgi:tetratricopeptide (TPR) repeat protein
MEKKFYTKKNIRMGLLKHTLTVAISIAVGSAALAATDEVINYIPTPGRVAGIEAQTWLKRGALMLGDSNVQGANDQLSQALRTTDDEAAAFNRALAAMRIPGVEAIELLEAFIDEYPSSVYRQQALVAIGDCYFDNEEYADALRTYREVDTQALNPSQAEALDYHKAYCLLKFAEYGEAEQIYNNLLATDYSNEARFYLGYIAYAQGNYKVAESRFKKVTAKGMPTIMADYYLAQIAFKDGNYISARSSARQLLTRTNVPVEFESEARRIYGESSYQVGDTRTAISQLETYVQQTDTPLNSSLYILGVENFRSGNYTKAIERLTPVTSEDNVMGQGAYLYIGQSYLELENYNAATLALEKACRMTHDSAMQETAFYNLAVAKMQGGHVPFGSTVSLLEEFLQRFPDSQYVPQVADYVAQGYMTDNNYAAALAALQKITRPDDNVLTIKQRVLYGLGTRELQSDDASSALTHLTEAASLSRLDKSIAAEATLWAGECYYDLGDYENAVTAYNNYLSGSQGSNANRALARYDLGYACYARKQFSEAATNFSKFIATTPDKGNVHIIADAYNRLADCYYYAADFTKAAENYEKAYKTDPSAGDYPTYQQGQMKGLKRDYSGKIEALNRMISEFPSSALAPSALFEMAESYGELGKTDRQIETYTTLASSYPSSPQGRKARLLLGITYLHSGNNAAAVANYKKVITDYPSSEEARVAAEDLKQIYADSGKVEEYVNFINQVPDAPRPETSELAAMTLQGAERAVDNENYTDALKLATEVVTKYPDSESAIDALAIKADAETRLGKSSDALESYKALESRASDAADINAARLGILRVSRDMGDNQTVVEMADKLLASTSLGTAGKNETAFLKAMALNDLGRSAEAAEIWSSLSTDIDDLISTKSAYYLAQYYYDAKSNKKALDAVNRLVDANPPHDYWLARGFILLSDILRAQGSDFEADEYLRSLRQNYPGTESDIFQMIDKRLK